MKSMIFVLFKFRETKVILSRDNLFYAHFLVKIFIKENTLNGGKELVSWKTFGLKHLHI